MKGTDPSSDTLLPNTNDLLNQFCFFSAENLLTSCCLAKEVSEFRLNRSLAEKFKGARCFRMCLWSCI